MIIEILTGLNFWLIVIFTGALVWLARQVIPATCEDKRWFQILLKVAPALIGAGVALIPALSPVTDSIQSLFIGFIGGTFSQTAYGILRSVAPDKIKSFIGGKSIKKP